MPCCVRWSGVAQDGTVAVAGDATTDPTTHAANIKRVRGAIGQVVLAFCDERLTLDRPEFHMADLDGYVREHARCVVAPESPARILRDLAARGAVVYLLISRRASAYRLVAVRPELALAPKKSTDTP